MFTEAMYLSVAERAGYLWQYAIFIIAVILCYVMALKYKKMACIYVGVCLFIIAAFKNPYLTNDTQSYIRTFQNIYYGFYSTYMEYGYVIYNRFLGLFSNHQQIVIIANAFITLLGFMFLFLRYSKNAYLTICLFAFFSVDGYVRILNLSRQYLSVAILLMGVPFIVRRRFIWFLLFVLVAGSIHTVGYMGILFYFLYDIQLNRKIIIYGLGSTLLLGATPLLDFVMKLLLYTPFARLLYLYDREFKWAALSNALFAGTIFIICWISYQKFTDRSEWKISPSFLLTSSFVSFCIYTISIFSHAFDRLAYIFSGLNMLALSNFISAYPLKLRWGLIVGVLGAFIFYSIISFVYRPEWGMPLPYSFCF